MAGAEGASDEIGARFARVVRGVRGAWRRRRPGDYRLSRWLFLRLLGVVFLIAFVSLWVQVDGLIGSHGILPVGSFLERVAQALGDSAGWRVPTLFWLGHGDAWLHAGCAAGVALSLALIVGLAPIPVLLGLWATYLSLVIAGQTFFSFQWDILLLEAGFTAAFLAPAELVPRRPCRQAPCPRIGLWLVWLLLFKLMFLSGAVKLLSMDDTWWHLTALDVHYFTQPLPTWTAWYANQLPRGFQRASVLIMFVIELGLPWLVLVGRRARRVTGIGTLFLMAMIAGTGNYTFFNLLTVVLCVPLFDDAALGRLLPATARRLLLESAGPAEAAAPGTRPRRKGALRATGTIRVALAAVVLLVSALTFVRELARTGPPDGPGGVAGRLIHAGERYLLSWGQPRVLEYTDPFHTISGYGLFRAMTTSRPEIVIEGSRDGREWREYEFRYKPGDVSRRPRFVEPHQPRLDWQMWFAALAPRRHLHWLEPLMARLLQGEPAVLALMGHNPFPEAPPRFVRLAYYDYTFTDFDERRETGAWWKRESRGYLTRPLTLGDLKAYAADSAP